ncbi:MAG TPA: membrane protein insertase YidC [Caulobacteraceae bacterium]
MQNDTRNFITFAVITGLLLLGYQYFVIGPMQKRQQAQQAHAQAAAAAQAPPQVPTAPKLTRAQALAATPRVTIDTPQLAGSISLTGARLDDLFLKQYRETTAQGSPPVELLRPLGAQYSYFAVNGWIGRNVAGLPDEQTHWTQTSQGALTDTNPLELSYSAPSGLVFHRQIKVDPQYLFTVTDTVQNTGAQAVSIAPYGSVQRRDVPSALGHASMEGAIGMLNHGLQEVKYPDWKKKFGETNACKSCVSTGGWLGITDKYWMTVFAPPQNEHVDAKFVVTPIDGMDVYETNYVGATRTLAPGASTSETTHLFAGAKVVQTLDTYGKQLGLFGFNKAVDWGWFEVLSKPVFQLLDVYAGWLGHIGLGFGWAILALTITIRGLMFPAFNASYAMSTKMKKVQPEMKALQERLKGDPPALQKEMMALYAREKINPVTGCIPMLLPLPVFYALNNVFNVTIEMRHASFGWVNDLSAPDPTTIWNLFGLIPWDPFSTGWVQAIMQAPFVGAILGMLFHLGAWPILYAATMWLSLMSGPTMTGIDPTQQKMMRWMPWVFMIVLAQSAVGLVIYWSFSSIFTIVQQYVLMRRFKVDNPLDAFLARLTHPKADVKAAE